MRPRLLLLLLLVAVAVVAWIAWPGADENGQPRAGQQGQDGTDPTMLNADSEEPGDPDAADPKLEGRGEEEAEEPERGDVEVKVVSTSGVPLANVDLDWTEDLGEIGCTSFLRTGHDGCATISDVPWDGSVCVDLHGCDSATVTGPTVVLTVQHALPVVLRPVDAATGESVKGVRWSQHPASPVRLPVTVPQEVYAPPEGWEMIQLVLDTPAVYTSYDPHVDFQASRYATSLVLLCPLRRESDWPAMSHPLLDDPDNDWPFDESVAQARALRGAERTTAVLAVRRRDGSPAMGACVFAAGCQYRADGEGKVAFASLPSGLVGFFLAEPGLTHTQVLHRLEAGKRNEVVLQEPQGGAVEVSVAGLGGSPLPCASVWLVTETGNVPTCWEDEANGVQRIDPFTDHLGRRLYEHVDPGKVTV